MMAQLSSRSSSMLVVVVVAVVSIATIVSVAQAQSDIQEWLDAHNAARQAVGANIPDLVWSDAAYNYALSYAQQQSGQCLPLMHSPSPRPYGENLAWNSDTTVTATWVVNDWVAEAQFYDYGSNSCVGGECGHYTQVVWAASTSVGCATVACADSSYPGSLYFICSYDPRATLLARNLTRSIHPGSLSLHPSIGYVPALVSSINRSVYASAQTFYTPPSQNDLPVTQNVTA